MDIPYFTTTLTISPLKNAEKINEIGNELANEYCVQWLPSDFKKKEGYKRSIELSKEYNLYRQNYCGCIYSKQIAENPKAEICAFKDGVWLRLACELVNDDRIEAKKSMLDAYENLRGMYNENDDNTQVLYAKNAVATLDFVLSFEFKIVSTNESAISASITFGFVVKFKLP